MSSRRQSTWLAVCALGILALLAAACGGSSHPKPTPTTTSPTAAASPTPQSATPTPTSTSPATISLPTTVAGKPLKSLVLGDPVEFPEHVALYVATSSCANCGFGAGDLWRVYRGHDGQLVGDHITPDPKRYADQYHISGDGSEVTDAICTGYCGGESFPSEDANLSFVLSHDGGITWEPVAGHDLPRTSVFFSGEYRGQVIANSVTYLPSNKIASSAAFLMPSFEPLTPPAGLPLAPAGSFPVPIATIGPDGRLLWELNFAEPPLLFDENGKAANWGALDAILPGLEWRNQEYGGTPGDVWVPVGGLPIESAALFVHVDPSGTPVEGFTSSVPGLTFATPISSTQWIGTAILPLAPGDAPGGNDNYHAVLIDAATGVIHPIHGLPGYASPLPGHFSWPRRAIAGDFWRVDTGADCLNVRQEASTSSASLGCFASGVLLRGRDATAPEGWRAVSTPDGRAGFAAAEFLR